MTNPEPVQNLPKEDGNAGVNNEKESTSETVTLYPDSEKQPALQWNRRTVALGLLGVASAWIAGACNRIWPSPTPTPTRSLLPTATPTRRGFLSRLATPTQTASPTITPSDSPLRIASEQQTYLPVVDGGITPTPTETATPEPPTPTPRPTDTPTPVSTPFPAGAPSKLGVHVERNVPELFQLLETKAMTAVTTLELDAGFAEQIKRTSPNTKLIGRIHVGEVNLSSLNPSSAAADFVNKILPFADDDRRRLHFDGWISYNEPVAGSAEDMKRLADFEAERTRLLGERGIRSVVGNFATGGPDLSLWEHFLPAVQAAKEYNGWLGLHEYAAPTIYYLSTREDQGRYPSVSPQDEGWLTLRYRKVYNQFLKPAGLAIPLVFTECGVDGLVQAGRGGPSDAKGWQHFQGYWAENGFGLWGPGAYIEQLVWFDQAMQQDDYVIGGCIYGLGTSAQWLSYDIKGPALGVLEQYLSVHVP